MATAGVLEVDHRCDTDLGTDSFGSSYFSSLSSRCRATKPGKTAVSVDVKCATSAVQ